MSPYLRASLICFAIAAIALWIFLTMGCATYTAMGACAESATYAISTVGEKHPVRVATGLWGPRERLYTHAQAQVWLDGEWKFLCVDFPSVETCPRDPEFSPMEYYVPWVWFAGRMSRMIRENRPN